MKCKIRRCVSVFICVILVCASVFMNVPFGLATTVFSDGFESGDGSAWTATGGAPEYVTDVKYNGSYSMKADANGEYTSKTLDSAQTEIYVQSFLRVTTLPTGGKENIMVRLMNGANIVGQFGVKDISGTTYWQLGYRNGGSLVYDISSTSQIYAATWFNVTIHIKCDAGGSGEYHIYINSVEVADLAHTGVNTVYSKVSIVRVGLPYTSFSTVVHFDDVSVADADGFTASPAPDPEDPPVVYATGVLPYTGVGTDYCLYFDSYSVERWLTSGKIANLATYVDDGFNSSRLSFKFNTYSYMASAASLLDYTKFDRVLEIFDSYNISVIPTAWDDQSLSPTFLNNYTAKWVEFANHYKGDNRIEAIALFNEPTNSILNASMNRAQFLTYATDLVQAIHAADPDRVCIFPLPVFMYSTFNQWYTDLQATDILTEPNVVFDIIHPYYFENDWDMGYTPTQKAAWYGTTWLSPAVNAFNSSNCWAGETFAWLGENTIGTTNYPSHTPNSTLQTEWLREIINTYASYGVGFSIWSSVSGQKWDAFVDVVDTIDYPIETSLVQYSLTVSSNVGGVVSPAVGTNLYYSGTVVNITLTPLEGYTASLSVDGVNVTLSSNSYQLVITQNTTVAALFYYPTADTYTLTVTSDGGGFINPDVGEHTYLVGSNVSVSAFANPFYSFVAFEFNSTTNVTSANTNFIITGNTTMHVYFRYDSALDLAGYNYTLAAVTDGFQLLGPNGVAYVGTNASYAINMVIGQGLALYVYDGVYSDSSISIKLAFTSGSLLIGESYNTIIVTNTISGSGTIGRLTLKGS